MRYELTRVRDIAENIALIGGDEDERAAAQGDLRRSRERWIRVIVQQARMTWIFNGSNRCSRPLVPLLLGAPKYLAGELALGELMQVATAFAQVQIALNWLADNAIRLAEWLASAQRVVELSAMLDESRRDDRPARIELRPWCSATARTTPCISATCRSRSRTASS